MRASDIEDVGGGSTPVSVFGSATRELRLPVVQDGMGGVSTLYHSVLQVDGSYTAWDGTGDNLKGGTIPLPELGASKLAVPAGDPTANAWLAVQPRPGTMPGLYVYYDNATGLYYQYGSPIDSGGSPASTAVYSDPTAADPSFGPGGTTWWKSSLSGAQLWYYGSASTPYIEIKHVDGSIARFDAFNPYVTTYTPSGVIWRATEVRDPSDNVATYVYDNYNRLIRIEFPSGLKQYYSYLPSWNWGTGYSCLEVSYSQTSGGTTTQLTDRTWGMVFTAPGATGGSHFGSRLHRTYSPARRVLKEASSGPYSLGSSGASSVVTGQIVHSFSYSTSPRSMTETQSVHVGSAFAQALSLDAALPDRGVLTTTYSSSSDRRVTGQQALLTGSAIGITYGNGTRTLDLGDLPSGAGLLAATVSSTGGSSVDQRSFEFYHPTGRVYSVIHTPTPGFYGRPRAAHAAGENSTLGGVAATDVEPDHVVTYMIFDAGCACQKPIVVEQRAWRGGSYHTRTTKFEYFADSKLLKKRTEINPATVPAPPAAEISWAANPLKARVAQQFL